MGKAHRHRLRRLLLLVPLVPLFPLVLTACGGPHLRLTNRGTSEGPLYVCDASSCETAQTDDPDRINVEGTVLIELPAACPEMSRAMLHRETPSVDVTCGPMSGPKTYRCSEAGGCVDVVLSEVGGTPVALPADCGGRIHEVLVQDATNESPRIYVQCDTSDGAVVGEM